VVVLAACTPGAATSAPTSVPSASVATSASPSPAGSASASRDPLLPAGVTWLEDEVLDPGTYWFKGFDPWLEITVDDGWEVGHFHREFFDLFRNGDIPSIGFGRFGVVKYRDGTTFEAMSADVAIDALKSNPELEVTNVRPASIAGLTGTTIDIRATREQTPLFATPNGDFRFDPEFRARLRVLDVPGGAIEILVAARTGHLDEAVVATQAILDSVRIVGP
jgi:hypothetical protein